MCVSSALCNCDCTTTIVHRPDNRFHAPTAISMYRHIVSMLRQQLTCPDSCFYATTAVPMYRQLLLCRNHNSQARQLFLCLDSNSMYRQSSFYAQTSIPICRHVVSMPQPQFTGQTAVSMPQQQFPGTNRAVSMPQRHFWTSVAVPRQQFACPDSCLHAATALPESRLAILAALQGCLEVPLSPNLLSGCSTGLYSTAQGLLLADLLHICSICCIWLGWLGQPKARSLVRGW